MQIDDAAVSEDAPWSSKHIVDMLCPKIEESGNPVQCYPVEGYPLGVTASWEPVQEGEGEPYPAGGGPNKFDFSRITNSVYYAADYKKGTITIPAHTNNAGYEDSLADLCPGIAPGTYIITAKTSNSEALRIIYIVTTQKSIQFDTPCDLTENDINGKFAWYNNVDSANSNTISEIQVVAGSTAPTTYYPYENIRPIVGRDSVTVERCGENLLDSMPELPIRIYKDSPEVVVRSGTLPAGRYTMNVKLDVIPSGASLGSALIKYELADGTEKYFVPRAQNETSTTVTFATAIRTIAVVNYGVIDGNITGISLVPGSAAPTTYEPYTGQTNTLTLPETVYGGSVDAVSGEGAGTWDLKEFKVADMDNMEAFPGWRNQDWLEPYKGAAAFGTLPGSICSCTGKNKVKYNGNVLYFDKTAFNNFTQSELKEKYSDLILHIALLRNTPTPFTATGGAALPALDGVNTVITDADSVAVSGRADPIKRIADLEAAVASIN